ncbi:Oxysterol-binding protein-related protein 1C [Hibiscus syriacus]|uniref:Oxysterol-binding protein-related protein 1C n=1 Tax=Hibiscus syriacus TaxID=106335 RepID=A0A6A2WZR3_HIBSY|nr:Oxysterol-binding protein-related protein 1C [Hibiscus syriacus]
MVESSVISAIQNQIDDLSKRVKQDQQYLETRIAKNKGYFKQILRVLTGKMMEQDQNNFETESLPMAIEGTNDGCQVFDKMTSITNTKHLEIGSNQENGVVLDTISILAEFPANNFGAYAISIATASSDVLEFLQRECHEKTLRVVPRFEKPEGSVTDTDEDNESVDTVEENTDEDEHNFFDTRDFLSSSPFKSNGSYFQTSSFYLDDGFNAFDSEDDIDPCIKSMGSNFPYMKRRKKLPDPVGKEKCVSIWSMIKDNIGKDLTQVCLPVYFNEGNNLMRILNVAAFVVSAYSSTEGRICKPFNPLLGETYEVDFPDKGLHFFSEKLDPVGFLTLEFDNGEVFQWSKVTTSIYNLILGKLYCDHQVHGIVQDRNGRTMASLLGKWDESMHYVIGDYYAKGTGQESFSETHTLWKRSNSTKYPTRYNLIRFTITLNELTPGLKEKLPPTDSRLRPDQSYLENGEYEMANSEKLQLEQRQRQHFIRSSKVPLAPVQKPLVPHAKPNFYCGSRSLPWLIRALLDHVSNKIATFEPMITGLQEALPKSIGLLPFDGGSSKWGGIVTVGREEEKYEAKGIEDLENELGIELGISCSELENFEEEELKGEHVTHMGKLTKEGNKGLRISPSQNRRKPSDCD